MQLQPQEISVDVLREKYAKPGEEGAQDIYRRVARGLAAVEKAPEQWEPVFHHALERGMVCAGRIMSATGTDIQATLINCFVQPVGDAMTGEEDGYPGIMVALEEAAETMRRGGGVGYDFSRIRPKGAKVKGTASSASGPLSYMDIYDSMCKTVESAGSRRGAQMGVLRCDHPDIRDFIVAKNTAGRLSQFNLSAGVMDAFMSAVESDAEWPLMHKAEPGEEKIAAGAYRRDDGLWVYDTVPARELFQLMMEQTYDHAEPGILFLDRANQENNLGYCETFEATNPCAEQWLPPYGACCLGSINLTRFVEHPFSVEARFDYEGFAALVRTGVRMLDNVLDVTLYPLERQRQESQNKRRIGLGFTGLGDALIMLGLRYDSDLGREMAESIARRMRDEAYMASVELAQEKGAFPLFKAREYLKSGFAKRLPEEIRDAIRKHGIRNSHLLSIAPTGTISLAFADNASNGIEPPFSWVYTRKKRQADGSQKEYEVMDHAWRMYQVMGGEMENRPKSFVTALEMGVMDHVRMLEVVQPYVDTAISKTVNIPEDYPYEQFKNLYLDAWRAGLKGLATFRPNPVLGAVLVAEPAKAAGGIEDLDQTDPDRRIRLEKLPEPSLASLRWAKRPKFANGNPAWSYMVSHPMGYGFAVFIGHTENGHRHPFEVWVNGAEQPRGLGALAKSLSMDMRSDDRAWLKVKLESLEKTGGDDAFDLPMPPDGRLVRVPSLVAGFAKIIRHRCDELGAFEQMEHTPVLDALMSAKEPKSGPGGTMSWTVDVMNPATGDDFVMGVKELVLPSGQRRPYSLWFSGDYPKAFDGLSKSLSYDMRVVDAAWVAAKLRQLLDYSEPRGDFMAKVPSGKSETFPSTVAYLARLILHRYAMLGILDETGYPIEAMGIMSEEGDDDGRKAPALAAMPHMSGRKCPECHNHTLIRKDGCDFCVSCSFTGACG